MKDLDLKNKAIKEAVKSHTDRLAASDNVIGQEEFDNKWKPEIESKIKGNSAVSLMTKEVQ